MKALSRLYPVLKRRRTAVLAFFACVALLSLLRVAHLSLNNSSVVFLPDADADMRLAAELLENSPMSGMLFVDVEAANAEDALAAADVIEKRMPPETARAVRFRVSGMTPDKTLRLLPSFFTPEAEATLTDALSENTVRERLRDARAALQGMGGTAAVPWVRGDPLRFRDVLLSRLPSGDASSVLSAFSRPVSADGRHSLLIFRPSGDALDASAALVMVQSVHDSARLLGDDVTVRMSGGPRYAAANARAIEHDIRRIALLSLAGLALAYALLARSWGALWIFLTPMAATAIAAAATACVWPVTSGLVLGFGMSLMGLAEDYAIHMHFALRSGQNEARVYQDALPPLTQGFLLNLSGFAVLLLSSIPAIRQMAFFSVASLTAGFLLAVLLLPFLPGFSAPKRLCAERAPRVVGRQASLFLSLIVCGGLFLACFASLAGVRADFSPRALSADGPLIARDAALMRDLWHLDSGMNVILTADSRDDALIMGSRCADALRKNGWKVTTPSDFLLPEKEAKDNCARWNRWLRQNEPLLHARLEKAAQDETFRAEAFRPFFDALPRDAAPLTADAPLLRELGLREPISMALFDQETESRILLSCSAQDRPERGADDLRAAIPPEYRAHALVFSPRFLETSVAERFRQEKTLLLFAELLALLLLALFLRRPAKVLAACAPPLLSLIAALAALRLLDLPLNLASLSALPIVFGLALDHGVMVTHALERGQDGGTRRAVVLSSLTAFMSMGLLAFSEHPALRSMGCVIFAGLAAELAAALWIIPRLYVKKGPGA